MQPSGSPADGLTDKCVQWYFDFYFLIWKKNDTYGLLFRRMKEYNLNTATFLCIYMIIKLFIEFNNDSESFRVDLFLLIF